MDTFSISWLVMPSVRIIPRGDTLRVTFCSFFPLALALGQTWVKGACLPHLDPTRMASSSCSKPQTPGPFEASAEVIGRCDLEDDSAIIF